MTNGDAPELATKPRGARPVRRSVLEETGRDRGTAARILPSKRGHYVDAATIPSDDRQGGFHR